MTKKKVKQEEGICPFCGSEKISYSDSNTDGEFLIYKAQCDDCEGRFNEIYKIKFSYMEKL